MRGFAERQQACDRLAAAAQEFSEGGNQLIRRVLAGFIPIAGSLPASERHHHSWPFGLFEHSLEVALGTLLGITAAARRSVLVGQLVAPTLVVALLHDVGKVFDVGTDHTWRRGRGFLGHPDQVELILTLTTPEWAVPVKAIADRYDARFRRPRPPEEPPLDYLADTIARADGQSAWRGRPQHPEHGRYLHQLLSSTRVAA